MDVIRPISHASDFTKIPDDGKRYNVLDGDLAVSSARSWNHQRIVHLVRLGLTQRENAGLGKVAVFLIDAFLGQPRHPTGWALHLSGSSGYCQRGECAGSAAILMVLV